jgi:hypothetical protein
VYQNTFESTRVSHQQLGLFSDGDEARRELQEQLDSLGASYEALDARYWALWHKHRDLQKDLAQAAHEVGYWRDVYSRLLASRHGATTQASLSKADLTRLLALAHPDRWSQGQLASELAHELSVALNAARAAL